MVDISMISARYEAFKIPLAGERLQPLGHLSVRAKRLNIYGFLKPRSMPNPTDSGEQSRNTVLFWHKADTPILETFRFLTAGPN